MNTGDINRILLGFAVCILIVTPVAIWVMIKAVGR